MPIAPRPAEAAYGPIADIAEILAAGLMRVMARKSSQISPITREVSLDISPAESGHPTPAEGRTADG